MWSWSAEQQDVVGRTECWQEELIWHFSSFPTQSTCSWHFLWGFYKSRPDALARWSAIHLKKEKKRKSRIRLSQGSDGPTAGSFKWNHPSSTLFLPLFLPLLCQERDHSSSHTLNSSSWSDGKPDGNFFFSPPLSLSVSLPSQKSADDSGKVKTR